MRRIVIKNNNFIFYDFETGSVNPHRTQPLQLAAIAIDSRRLQIVPNSAFQSYIKPVFDEEECIKYNLDPVSEEALKVNNIKIESLEKAPSVKEVWNQFTQYVEKYNIKKGKWGAPIKCGYNNIKFDDVIVDRLCGGQLRYIPKLSNKVKRQLKTAEKCLEEVKELSEFINQFRYEPYKFGPWDEERNEETLFFPRDTIDVMRTFIWPWTENMDVITNINMDAVREWLELSTDKAHDAMFDVEQGAGLLIRFLSLHRKMHRKVKWTQTAK